MPQQSQTKEKNVHLRFKTEIQTLLQLPNFSITVQEILRGWLAIRNYLLQEKLYRLPLSNIRAIKSAEYQFLDRIVNRFEVAVAKDAEFQRAVASTRESVQDRQTYHSIRLYGQSQGMSLLHPWLIYYEARHNDDVALLQTIINHLTKFPNLRRLPQFVDFFVTTLIRSPVKRSILSVQYLRALLDLHYATREHQFPTQVDLHKIVGCSERTVLNFETAYTQLSVVQPRYLVNMGRLGFHTVRVVHQESLPAFSEPFVLRTYPLDRTTFVSILYLPSSSDLLDHLPGQIAELTTYRIARNLDQLNYKPEKSWPLPNRLLGDSARVRPPRRGIWNDLIPNPNPPARTLTEFKMLDQIQLLSPGVYTVLADSLDVSEKLVRLHLCALLQDKVISPFYNIDRIGLESTLLVVYNGAGPEIEALENDLLSFPYTEMFSGPTGGNIILKMPTPWTLPFFDDANCLQEQGLDLWATRSYPKIARWGIPLADLVQNDEFFGTHWVADSTQEEMV